MGVDFLNQSERVYRLLGCELRFHGSLPKPGDTLAFDIHVDGHANQGDVRLFFFHYDCTIGGAVRLSVRNGQAGFFTDEELAASGGVLWDAETTPAPPDCRLDPPAVSEVRRAFSREQIRAFGEGRMRDAFGPTHTVADAHVKTPRLPADKLCLLQDVDQLDPAGGPWGRGYLRSRWKVSPDDWFFAGHFKNDPCMPGTLMYEGCLQAMALYMTAFGFTLERDGWRFEPVPDETYTLRCRGQVTPSSKEFVYELFVSELHAGPVPTLFADILCTVDGRKAFHCARMGLRLVPDWPLESGDTWPEALPEARPVASTGDFPFDHASLQACAWGRPSLAFGPAYVDFDGPRRLPRLPGPLWRRGRSSPSRGKNSRFRRTGRGRR
jgi:3-hydroxymyristoyl/3-hydroxydecanoyl-(acyl carrier protein) dehydratase